MEMSAKQPLCQSNYDADEICVWGAQWRPLLPTLPAICATLEIQCCLFSYHLPSLFLFYLSQVLNTLLTHFVS